jgi:hypothetical protein
MLLWGENINNKCVETMCSETDLWLIGCSELQLTETEAWDKTQRLQEIRQMGSQT